MLSSYGYRIERNQRRIHWSFPDPAAAQGSGAERLATFVTVRDAIEARLREWLVDISIE